MLVLVAAIFRRLAIKRTSHRTALLLQNMSGKALDAACGHPLWRAVRDVSFTVLASGACNPSTLPMAPSLPQDAQKFARHAKRTTLTVEDINNALRLRNFEVCVWGWGCSRKLAGR